MIAQLGQLDKHKIAGFQWPLKLLMEALVLCTMVFWGAEAFGQCDFKTIGHRGGASYYYPENTLVALEQGFIAGIYAAEVDVRYTSDSVLVLMHDSYVDRTTNGTGTIRNLPYSYIKTLDAGSWKGAQFKGTHVPTLVEALELAKRYQKKLYLNMKVYTPKLIARVLQEANVAADMVMPDPDSQGKVSEYHKFLPNTPLVYFGSLPDDVDDASFYSFMKTNGVIAIEIPADYIRYASDDTYTRLRDNCHANNLELWAYTVNDAPYFQMLKDFGIDGLETDRPEEASQVFCHNGSGGFFPEKLITGQWDFNGNLEATIGSKMGIVGDPATPGQQIVFGTTATFGLPSMRNAVANIARIPAFDPDHALRFFSNIAPEGMPGVLDCDNTFSVIFDLLKPKGTNSYTAILQTSNNNADDGDIFLRGSSNGVGVLEQYRGSFPDSSWVRLALVFDLYNDKIDEYLDGEFVGTVTLKNGKDGRFCMNNNWGVQSSNFFSDDDGETNPMFVSSIQLRNYAMTADEIRLLGNAKAAKIDPAIWADPEALCPEFNDAITLSSDANGFHLMAQAGDTVNYRWEMNTGSGWQTVSGASFAASTSTLSIVSNASTLDGYRFRCIAFNDCPTISEEFLFKGYTGFSELDGLKNEPFILYPNPSRQSVTIDFLGSPDRFDIAIYSILGVEVYQQPSVVGKCQVNLPKGTYLVKASTGQKTMYKKLIVKD